MSLNLELGLRAASGPLQVHRAQLQTALPSADVDDPARAITRDMRLVRRQVVQREVLEGCC